MLNFTQNSRADHTGDKNRFVCKVAQKRKSRMIERHRAQDKTQKFILRLF